ncbi:MAG TPA: peptidoglycan-binding protein [Acidimicrobiales bacterium]|nr:peptidoglycan-binding protein [Acidimicrobiales bacterium]
MTKFRGVAIVVTVAVAGTAIAAWSATRSGGAQPHAVADKSASSSLATISERTLTSQQQVNGTLGYAGAATVIEPVGTPPGAVAQADQQLASARQTLTGAQSTSPRVAWPALVAAQSAAAAAHASAVAYDQTSAYSMLPAVGQVISRGQPLFAIAGQPVLLLYGGVVQWRAFVFGMSTGPDVAELNQNLADLGYGAGLAGSDMFTSATAAAIWRLQRASGLPPTGELLLGAVVFKPGAVRVTTVSAKLTAAVQPGAPVLDLTSTTRQVTVQLDAAQQSQVKVGDPVTITLPDNQTTPATVSAVGTVAKAAPSTSGGDSNAPPTVEVDITPNDSAATGTLDAAPVQVSITTASAANALVVPVTALLAMPGGGYAVDVVSAGGLRRLAKVTLGLFDDAEGLVQISGPDVHPGQQVEVAGS